ncbi:MAG: hypothetical protein MUF48_10270 [Pirellulaceae bacterium]|jgi:hypothetical protein|nr:hypothetical protein [Pirellulaceae bacterium]
MEHEAAQPSVACDAAGAGPRRDSAAHATILTEAERRTWATSRKIAFAVLAATSLAAGGGAVFFWYLWAITVRLCVDTYLLHTRPSVLLMPEQATSWRDYFSGLDISSFSALILALLCTRLAYVGARNTLRYGWRDGGGYFARAYHSVLFTERFESLCIRLGLLGTLLSFLLAAVAQMSTLSPRALVSNGPTLTDQIARVAEGPGAESPATDGSDGLAPEGLTTSQLSEDIFLLLCASLVSTFVGTGVAYVITPALNWLHDRAVGRHQLREVDASLAAEQFFRQIARTSERLEQFELTTARLTHAAGQIATFETGVSQAAQRLAELLTGLERLQAGLAHAMQTFDVSTRTGKQLAKRLDQIDAMSARMTELLDRLPDRLNDPLKNMALTAMKFRESAMSGEAAFRELKHAASTARESLEMTHQHTHDTWHLLREIHTSVSELAQQEPPAADPDSAVAAAHVRTPSTVAPAREPRAGRHPRRRPWWRRLFG